MEYEIDEDSLWCRLFFSLSGAGRDPLASREGQSSSAMLESRFVFRSKWIIGWERSDVDRTSTSLLIYANHIVREWWMKSSSWRDAPFSQSVPSMIYSSQVNDRPDGNSDIYSTRKSLVWSDQKCYSKRMENYSLISMAWELFVYLGSSTYSRKQKDEGDR